MIAHAEKCFSISDKSKSNFDCNHTFPTDLAPDGVPFGAKSIEKVLLQSKFGLIQPD